jgi:alpha-L-rhamnosidase
MDLIHDNYGDESHPDVCIAGIISANILGIAPEEPGFSRFSFRPHPGDLKFAEGSIPTPHGEIRARWDRTEDGLEASVSVPEGTVCEFGYGFERRTFGPGRHAVKTAK